MGAVAIRKRDAGMKTWNITATEQTRCHFQVKASSRKEALQKAEEYITGGVIGWESLGVKISRVEKGDDKLLPGKDCAGSLRPTRTDPGDYCKSEVEK